jgi:N-acetylmuramoyl-L-alanine amidase
VLRTSDMPAMLVETGFISNPDEEKRLSIPATSARWPARCWRHQSYFTRQPPPGTLYRRACAGPRKPGVTVGRGARGGSARVIPAKAGIHSAIICG